MTETEEMTETEAPLVDLYLDGSTMSSPVVEIIGGMTLGPFQSPERAAAAASLEEGDDEVFYEDEATPRVRGETSGTSGSTNVSAQPRSGDVCPNDVEADGGASPTQGNETGGDPDSGGGESLTTAHIDGETGPHQNFDTAQHQEHRTPPTATASTPALELAPDQTESPTAGESLAEPQTQAEQVSFTDEGEQIEGATSPQEQTSPPEEEDGSGQMNCEAEDKMSEESQDELNQDQDQTEAQQSQDSLSLRGTQSLRRKSELSSTHKKSFDHHTHSKYSTVSYRKIRRGNTRQKIDEFESMMMNI